ncbi:MAG: RNA polymerase sigma factor RpoD, partial [Gammaproteobacteria bacterium]|nr:RNA polymerase sigma factor RpoD [Gammaproteobacteria bacterium]
MEKATSVKLPEEDERQSQLKLLIAKGKEQGYLTYGEVNDHLPSEIVDPEQIEDIVNMINDMGITVYEKASDAESVVLSDSAVSSDDDTEEAAAALATVDSEFGRTTDPVRMYMREMGTVELLTREGEIRIAKRIEEGLDQVRAALVQFPPSIDLLVTSYDRVTAGETRLQDVIVGFIDPNAQIADPNAKTDDDSDEPPDTGPDPAEVAKRMKKVRRLYKRYVDMLLKHGIKHASTQKAVRSVVAEFMEIKLAPKLFEAMVASLRDTVNGIRSLERQVMALCVRDARMPRKDFIASFPKNETNLGWVDKHI